MPQYSWFNCPKDIRTQVVSLVDEIQFILGVPVVGIYLHGSLATGCFNPSRSDLDILVVQGQASSIYTKRCLAELLLSHSNDPAPIEISFLTVCDIRPWQYPTPYDFHYGEDHRERVKHDLVADNWKQWNTQHSVDEDLAAHITVTLHRGVCLYGAPISEVFPIVPHEDYLSSILSDLKWVCDHVTESPVYAVLNMCRVLAYVWEAKIYSKQEAGEWALHLMPHEFISVIRSALDAYSNMDTFSEFDNEALISFASYMDNEVGAA